MNIQSRNKMKSKNKSLTNIYSTIAESIKLKTHRVNKCKEFMLNNNKHVTQTQHANVVALYKTPQLNPTIQLYKISSSNKKHYHNGKIIKLNKSVSNTNNKINISINNNPLNNNSNNTNNSYITLLPNQTKPLTNSITNIPLIESNTFIKAYSYSTNEGNVRTYNEDRVSIHSYQLPSNGKYLHYFALFDGHGGDKCANYLRDNLYNYLISDSHIETNIPLAIQNAFRLCEQAYQSENTPLSILDDFDRSGSTALVVIIIDNKCYCANVGDSRAIYVENGKLRQMNTEHKPNEHKERYRIIQAGGSIYQNKATNILKRYIPNTLIKRPWRVNPGGLSVSYIV